MVKKEKERAVKSVTPKKTVEEHEWPDESESASDEDSEKEGEKGKPEKSRGSRTGRETPRKGGSGRGGGGGYESTECLAKRCKEPRYKTHKWCVDHKLQVDCMMYQVHVWLVRIGIVNKHIVRNLEH